MELETKLLITELNKEENKELEQLCKKYIDNKQKIAELETQQDVLLEEIERFNIKTIGLQDQNLKMTITKSKEVAKIDYEATLQGQDSKEFKKQKISMVWDDDKIIDTFKEKVVTKFEKTKPSARITEMVKGE